MHSVLNHLNINKTSASSVLYLYKRSKKKITIQVVAVYLRPNSKEKNIPKYCKTYYVLSAASYSYTKCR